MTEREKFRQFVEKHPNAAVDGFWWCSGIKWESRRYCVVLLARSSRLCAGLELRATTAQGLAAMLRAEGYEPPRYVARLCETAGCSPRPPKAQRILRVA